MMKKNAIATTDVKHPSRIKIHLHARYPLIPFILPIAAARRPPNAPARVVLEKKKLKRF